MSSVESRRSTLSVNFLGKRSLANVGPGDITHWRKLPARSKLNFHGCVLTQIRLSMSYAKDLTVCAAETSPLHFTASFVYLAMPRLLCPHINRVMPGLSVSGISYYSTGVNSKTRDRYELYSCDSSAEFGKEGTAITFSPTLVRVFLVSRLGTCPRDSTDHPYEPIFTCLKLTRHKMYQSEKLCLLYSPK